MMTLRRFPHLVLILLALFVFAVPAAHAAPPKGDDVNAPVSIAVNATKTVKNIHLANVAQPSWDGLPSCDLGGTATNSVWFSFTLDTSGQLDFSSGGSLLITAEQVHFQPLIAVFRYNSALSYTEAGCSTASGSISNLWLNPGEYRVLLGNREAALLAGSRYRLNIRASMLNGFLVNRSFENPVGLEWKIKKMGYPPQIYRFCHTPTDCGMRFNGAAKGKIIQTYTFNSAHLRFIKGDLLTLRVGAAGTPPTGATIRYILQVTYSDGTPPSRKALTHEFVYEESASVFVVLPHLFIELPSGAVKTAKVTISSPEADDTFMVKHTTIDIYRATYARDGVQPLPLAP